MKIVIVGGGKVGTSLIESLVKENHDISVIDSDADVINSITSAYDVMGLVGNGASFSVQIEAGVEEADLLIAVTESDERNLLACLFAKKAGNCKTIARVRTPIYNQEIGYIKDELGLSMVINPEFAAAGEIAKILRFPTAIDIDTFVKGRVELLEFVIPEGNVLNGLSLIDISKRGLTDVLICTVKRGDDIIIPHGNFVLQSNDMISIIASPANSKEFFKKIGLNTHQVKDCIIVGGGKIAYYLAKQIIPMGIDVKIIESDYERCKELDELLPEASIICGDATSQEVLEEEGLKDCQAFVTLTGIDEGNMFLSLYAKNNSNAKIVTKVNKVSFNDIIDSFNLGSVIYPKHITTEYIIRYVRAMQNSLASDVESLHQIVNSDVEALEFIIKDDSRVNNIPLKNLKLKKNLLVACVYRNGQVIIANGNTELIKGDSVVVVTTQKGLDNIADILAE